MSQTLEQVNAVRRLKGEEPLTELPNEQGASHSNNPPTNTPPTQNEPPNPQDNPAPVVNLSDDAVLKYLQEQGISVASIEDLKKPATVDPEKAAEDRESAKLSYGLSKGLVSRKVHEQFIVDKSNKQQLVFAQYYQEAKKEDPELTDEDIQAEFAAKFGLDAEPNTRKHKRGLQEIEVLGNVILRNKYDNIYKLDSEYDVHEKNVHSRKETERKILSEAPTYKKVVDEVFSELKKVTTKFSDDESYEVEVLEDALANLKSKFLDSEYVAQKIVAGYSREELKDVAYTALLKENWPVIAKEMIKQALHNQQKGVKGIVPLGKTQGGDDPYAHMNDQQKAALQRIFPNQQPVVAN